MIVEANHERRNEIEFFSEVRQRTERLNSLNHAANTEQSRDFPKHWQAIHVEANSGMTEELRDIEEISCAAAQIEDLLGTRQVEFKLANSPDVNSDPAVEIEIFRPVGAGVRYGVPPANLCKTSWINCLDDTPRLEREAIRSQQPERMFSCAGKALTVH
jgi:hypothetical protein